MEDLLSPDESRRAPLAASPRFQRPPLEPAIRGAALAEATVVRPQISDRMVVVLGAGTMGPIIARQYAVAGCKVVLFDILPGALLAAEKNIAAALSREAVLPQNYLEVLGRIRYIDGVVGEKGAIDDALRTADLVIEALPERREIKIPVLRAVTDVCASHTPIVSNSSSNLMRELTAGLPNPERFLNGHWLQDGLDPVEVMPMPETSAAAVELFVDLLRSAGLVPIHVRRESKGFIFNIIWKAIKEESLKLIANGTATAADIDRVWIHAFKSRLGPSLIGPCGIMDIVGTKVVLDIAEEYWHASADDRDKPPQFLYDMVAAGKLGAKAGEGFYKYPNPEYRMPGFLERGDYRNSSQPIFPTKATLIREWNLTRFVKLGQNSEVVGYPFGENAQGSLEYTIAGNVHVNIFRPNRAAFSSPNPLDGTEAERAAANRSLFHYSGKFVVGPGGLLFHWIRNCSWPNWDSENCSSPEVRHAAIEDGKLVLRTPPDENEERMELMWASK